MKGEALTDLEHGTVENIVSIVRDYLHPKRIILFGSRARGTGRRYSDYDIAVEGAKMDIRKERLLKDVLDERLGILIVDIIDLDRVDNEFRRLIMKSGIVLYEG